MLSKDKRLNLTTDFKFVVSGKRIETPNFKLYLKQGTNEVCRVGIAMSKGEAKKAHDRNRIRRLTSTAVQSIYPLLPNRLNLVIIPKSSVLTAKVEDLQKELESVKTLYIAD